MYNDFLRIKLQMFFPEDIHTMHSVLEIHVFTNKQFERYCMLKIN